MKDVLNRISILLQEKASPGEPMLEKILREVLQNFHSETGTIHALDPEKQLLQLAAQAGLPPQMLDIVKTIPVGKGIAGQVAAENRPVTICNLQTDAGGVAKPGAKQTGVGGALCVPIRQGDQIVGTFGIGTLREREYSAAEINLLQDIADLLGTNRVFVR
jgi:L-methionine (R)-S-oxide reductase